MKITEILTEHVVNATTPELKQKYADEIWNLLQTSYAKAGGFKSAANVTELIEKTNLWKIVTRDGAVSAFSIYRDRFGKKSIASGTNGTPQGRKDYEMIKSEDTKFNRAWAEVSGPVERIMVKTGAKPLPAKYAPVLTKHEIMSYNDDGLHYTRLIAGEPHEKIIYGTVVLTPELEQQLTAHGITFHDFPSN